MDTNKIRSQIKNTFDNFYVRNIILAGLILIAFLMIIFIFLRIYTHHNQSLSVPDLEGLSINEAEKIIRENKLRYTIIDSIFIPELEKGVIVEQSPVPGFKVKKRRMIFLTTNSHTPEKVILPSVEGVSLRQARAILETRGLQIGELIYVPDIAINYVLDMKLKEKSIHEGDTIFKGTPIDLVVGQGLGDEKTNIPNLIELHLEEAKDLISKSFLNLGATVFDNTVMDFEDSINALIWKQNPEHDEHKMVQLGSFVDVWLTLDSTKLPEPDTLLINEEDVNGPVQEDN